MNIIVEKKSIATTPSVSAAKYTHTDTCWGQALHVPCCMLCTNKSCQFSVTDFLHCQTFEWMLIHKYLIGPLYPLRGDSKTLNIWLTRMRDEEGEREKTQDVCVCVWSVFVFYSEWVAASQHSVTVMSHWHSRREGRKHGSRVTEGKGEGGWGLRKRKGCHRVMRAGQYD